MQKTGAEILIECLIREKVEIIFGILGGVILPVFDQLYDCPIRFVLTGHEQGAAHMADGYSRSTGKVGVCITTSGPGATNLVTGLATAHMDSVPIVAITGQVATNLVGNDAFQEADITGITRSVTKHNYLVKDVKDLARIIREAFYIARTGRPGPVLIDLPVDVQRASAEFIWPEKIDIRSYNPTYQGHIGQIKKAAELINQAKQPILYVGGGVIISEASQELKKLAEKTDIPVTPTLMGIGCFPAEHPLSLGMLGMHGTFWANLAIQNSDLIIAVGARFDDRVTGKVSAFAPKAKIIHIDIDPTSISKNIKADIPVVGDAKNILAELIKHCNKKTHPDWLKQIALWRKECPLVYRHDDKLRPQYIIEEINEITKGEAIICTDVGQHQMFTAQFFKFNKPRQLITSGGLGTMGFGFPAAIGAQFANPDKIVFDIAGDGSFQMNIQELITAVRNRLPVKIAVLNNGFLGLVRQWQELFFKKHYSGVCLWQNPSCPPGCNRPTKKCAEINRCPDFARVAESYKAVGITVRNKSDVRPALKKALTINDRPVVIDFLIEQEENVFPMVPAGAALDEILRGLA